MKLLFSASDYGKIEKAKMGLTTAGIACEARNLAAGDDGSGLPLYPELWVKHEKDYLIASRVLARMRIG